ATLGCAGCHGVQGTATLPDFPNIDPAKQMFTHSSSATMTYDLETYITNFMPAAADKCIGDCARDIAAYIRTWQPDEPVLSCEATDIHYGRRQMRLLTQREYEATVYDLTGYTVVAKASGVPADTEVEGFSNQTLTPVTQAYMDAYVAISQQAAEFVAANNFAQVANCDGMSTSQCASEFIDGFLPKAYRRPLTDAEKNRYRVFFTPAYSEGKNDEGLRLALRTALSSPHFLYRSEMGEKVADIRDRIANGDVEYAPGTVQLTLEGGSLATEPDSDYNDIPLYQNFGISAGYNFTGHDIITITAKGIEANGAYPSIELRVDNTQVGTVLLSSDYDDTVSFVVEGVVGSNKYVQITNAINGAQHTDGRILSLKKVTFADAVEVVQPMPPAELEDEAYILTPYEMASFLSYTYTGTMPDTELFEAAATGALSSAFELEAQVDRLLKTPQARDHFGEFAAQWFATDNVLSATKNAELYPDFTPAIRKLMAQEVREIVKHVMFDGEQSVSAFYDNFSFMNAELANYYGVSGVTGNDFTKVSNLSDRGGVLTSGAFMAGFAHEEETSPIKRAVAVRERMLCHKVPPMPTDIDAAREDVAKRLQEYIEQNGQITNRERYAFLTKDVPCSSCHDAIINPHGFGMENIDSVGLMRTVGVNGKAIDASGQLIGTNEMTDNNVLTFHGARQLSDLLENLPSAQSCFAEKGFRFVMGIGHDIYDHVAEDAPELAADEKAAYQCGIDTMTQRMSSQNQNARAALIALGASDFIRYRKQR
ncbi:MAG: DUF1592 domain-containing protein, partial [Reinekea sp.]|nr:DUF1592 domain-containing protein [Reinekea sp.]